jgi:hypothetical protein
VVVSFCCWPPFPLYGERTNDNTTDPGTIRDTSYEHTYNDARHEHATGMYNENLLRGRTTRKHDMNTIHKMVYRDEIHKRSTRIHDEDRVRDRFTGRHDEGRAPTRTTRNAFQGQQCCSVDFLGDNPAQRGSEGEQTKPNPSSQGIPGGTPAQTGSRRDARIFGPGGTPAQAGPGRQAGLVLREPVNSFNTCSIPDPDDSCQEVHAKNVRFLRQRSGRTHHQFFEKIGLGSQSTMDEVRIRDW